MKTIKFATLILALLLVSPISLLNAENVDNLPRRKYKKSFAEELEELGAHKKIVSDIYYLHPTFRNKVIRLIFELERVGIEVKITETYRSNARQNRWRKRGKSQLRGGRSKHQYGLAVDLVPIKNGRYDWGNWKAFKKIGELGESMGLIWGGRWKEPYDPSHLELNWDVESVLTGKWPKLPDTTVVPINFCEKVCDCLKQK